MVLMMDVHLRFRLVCVCIAVFGVVRCHQNQQGQQAFGVNQNNQPHIHNAQPPPQQQQQQQQYQQQVPSVQQPHQQQQQQGKLQGHVHDQQQPSGVFDKSQVQDREHIREHLDGVAQADTSKMSEQELQFHYFKMHDSDNNNMLDGSELIKSLIHWHVTEENHPNNPNRPPNGPKIFDDKELESLIDPILQSDDTNLDGFVDYAEFSSAQARIASKQNTHNTNTQQQQQQQQQPR